MKHPFIIFSLLLIGGCQWLQNNSNTPGGVAVAFAKAIGNLDFEAAAKFCTPETADLLEPMSSIVSNMPQDRQKEAQEQAKFISSAKCDIKGDKARCIICCSKNGSETGEALTLRLGQNGRWLVHIDKNDNSDLGRPAED